jgi:hypothetical protein
VLHPRCFVGARHCRNCYTRVTSAKQTKNTTLGAAAQLLALESYHCVTLAVCAVLWCGHDASVQSVRDWRQPGWRFGARQRAYRRRKGAHCMQFRMCARLLNSMHSHSVSLHALAVWAANPLGPYSRYEWQGIQTDSRFEPVTALDLYNLALQRHSIFCKHLEHGHTHRRMHDTCRHSRTPIYACARAHMHRCRGLCSARGTARLCARMAVVAVAKGAALECLAEPMLQLGAQ